MLGYYLLCLRRSRTVLLPAYVWRRVQPEDRGVRAQRSWKRRLCRRVVAALPVAERCLHRPLVMPSDNCAPMKAQTIEGEARRTGRPTFMKVRRWRSWHNVSGCFLEQARERTAGRWGPRPIRSCEPVGPTTLNPDVEKVVA